MHGSAFCQSSRQKDAAHARSDNELCVGGVNSAFTVEMTESHLIWSI